MKRRFLNRVTVLMVGPCLAVTSLLLVFLLLGRSTAGATPEIRFQEASFTMSVVLKNWVQ